MKLGRGEGERVGGLEREERVKFMRDHHDRQHQGAGNQAQRTWNTSIHNFAIGHPEQDLSRRNCERAEWWLVQRDVFWSAGL